MGPLPFSRINWRALGLELVAIVVYGAIGVVLGLIVGLSARGQW